MKRRTFIRLGAYSLIASPVSSIAQEEATETAQTEIDAIPRRRLQEMEERITETLKEKKGSLITFQCAADDIVSGLNGKKHQFRAALPSLYSPDRITGISNALGRYRDYENTAVYKKTGIRIGAEASKLYIGKVGMASAVAASGPVGTIIALGITSAAIYATDEAAKLGIAGIDQKQELMMQQAAKEYKARHGSFDALKESTGVQRYYELGLAHDEDSLGAINISDEKRTSIANYLNEKGRLKLETSSLDELAEQGVRNTIDLSKMSLDVANLAVGVVQLDQKYSNTLETLNTKVGEYKKQLDVTTKMANENKEDIGTLVALIAPGLSPAQRKRMVEDGLIDVPSEHKKATLAKLDEQIEQQEFVAIAGNIVSEGTALVKIMSDVGIEPGPVADIVSAGSALFSAYVGFKSGQVLGGFSAVTGLFGGGGGPDPAIMAELRKISRKLDEIDQKLDFVLENQQKIIDGINQLSDQLQVSFDSLTSDILFNRELILSEYSDDIKQWKNLKDQYFLDARNNQLASYKEISKIVRSVEPAQWAPFNALAINNFDPSPRLLVRAYEGEMDDNNSIMKGERADAEKLESFRKSYEKLIRLAFRLFRFLDIDPTIAVEAFLSPTDSVVDVDSKLNEIKSGTSILLDETDGLSDGMSKLLYITKMAELAELSLNFHYVRACTDSQGSLYSKTDLLEGKISLRGKIYLENASNICDLAIAQQALLGGDILLPIIYDLFSGTLRKIESPDDDAAKLRNEVISVLEDPNFEMLRKNVGVYFVCRRLWENSDHYQVHQEYSSILTDSTNQFRRLHKMLRTSPPGADNQKAKWKIEMGEDNSAILHVTDKLDIPFPRSVRCSKRSITQLHMTSSLLYLADLKASLSNHLLSYDFSEISDSETTSTMILLGSIQKLS